MSIARGYPPRPFCSNCILWFDTPAALTKHVTSDPEHIPFICETCGRHTFLTLEELRCHQLNCSTSRPYKTESFCPDCIVWYGSGREALEKHWREGKCRYKPTSQSTPAGSSGARTYNHSTHDGTRNADAQPRSTAVPPDMGTEGDSDDENPSTAYMTPDDSDQSDGDDLVESEPEEEQREQRERMRRKGAGLEACWDSDRE